MKLVRTKQFSDNHILVFTEYYPHKGDKNPETTTSAVHYFCREWVKKGYKVSVFLINMNFVTRKDISIIPKSFDYEINEGVDLYRIGISRLIPKSNFLFNFQRKKLFEIISQIIKDKNININFIVAHFPVAYIDFLSIFLKEFDAPKYFTLHNKDVSYLEKKGYKKFEQVVKLNYVIVLFRSINIANKYNNISKQINDNIEDSLVYSGTPIILSEVPKKNKNTLLYVGQLVKNKNVDIIIKALAQLKNINFKFNIIGVGPEYDNLKELILKLELDKKVFILGEKSREEVLRYMRESEHFVMVSTRETFGLVYIEALSMGCITVGTKGQGIDGVIDHGVNGYLVKAESVEELKNLFANILNITDNSLDEIRRNAVKTGVNFSEEKMAQLYLDKIVGKKINI